MRSFLIALGIVMVAAPAMACTSSEMADKAKAAAAGIQTLAASKNTQALTEWGKFNAANPSKPNMSIDDACAYYDKLNDELAKLNR